MLFFFSTSGLQHFLAMNLIIWTCTIPGESILNSYWISLALPISSFIRRILFSSLFPIAHHNIHLYYNIHLYCLSNIDFYQQCSVVLFPQMHISTVHLSSYKDHAIIETKKKKKKAFLCIFSSSASFRRQGNKDYLVQFRCWQTMSLDNSLITFTVFFSTLPERFLKWYLPYLLLLSTRQCSQQ